MKSLYALLAALGLNACATAREAPLPAPAAAPEPESADRQLTLERIFADPPLEGRAPTSLTFAPNGRLVAYLAPSPDNSDVLDLMGVDLPKGSPRTLVATADLLKGGTQRLTEAERMALERRRITKSGITSFAFCGDSGDLLMFPFSGDLYLARLGGDHAAPTVTRVTNDPEAPEMQPRCSPDGRRIAFVRDQNVHVIDVASNEIRAITKDGGDTRSFGLAEFVAEEEMGRHDGFWWAPDSRTLLVFEVDEAPVGVKQRAQIFATRTELVAQRYPAAGEANAKVAAWLFDTDARRADKGLALKLPAGDAYLARAGFFPDGNPWIQWQSRDQKTLQLIEFDKRGTGRVVLEERDDAWVELHDDLRVLPDGKSFLWSTERSGRRQLVIVDRANGTVTPLTDEPEPVHALLAFDKATNTVFYDAWRSRGRELRVFSMSLTERQALEITPEPGWHQANFDASGRFFVDRYSDVLVPPRTTIRDARGEVVFTVDANPAEALRALELPRATWLDVTADDGTVLNGLLFAPTALARASFSPQRRFPVISWIYGGPGTQTVRRGWQRMWLQVVFWTQRGYGVFMLDNRGMTGRDRAFTRAHLNAFGDVEIRDQRAGYEALKAVSWVDPARVAIAGWSYGGFLSARAVLDAQTPFAAAAAVAPVTDWTLYDTHYTERYIGLPQRDGTVAEAYAKADLVPRASLLNKPFLLMHGTADDNVLFEHSLRLAEALQTAGRLFDLMIYPGKAHGIAGRPAQYHVWKTMTAFFDRHLRDLNP
jgi:dipeptidyl-peptidase-4